MTELFIDNEHGAKNYGSTPHTEVERAQLGGLTNLEFETLWAILEGVPWDPESHSLHEIVAGDNFWVHQFPASYVDKLRGLKSSEMAEAAASWAATDEISATPEEVSPIIDQLVALARSAVKNGKGLFVWTSL
jgi:hypothetical protein